MTGIFVRIWRDGRPQRVALETLTPEEWEPCVAAQPPEAGWVWARALALWIRDTVHGESD